VLTLFLNLDPVPWLGISGAKLYLNSSVNQWRAQVAIYTYIHTYTYVCACVRARVFVGWLFAA